MVSLDPENFCSSLSSSSTSDNCPSPVRELPGCFDGNDQPCKQHGLTLTWSCEMDDLTQYVLPFVGTKSGGNVFPGVTRPFGMVKLGPDLLSGQVEAYAGYLPEGDFTGFSMMHLSGTGGIPMYGVVSQLPVVGEIENPLDVKVGRASPDSAEVGYYKAQTTDDVVVELAATEHAAMYQYRFPNDQASILIDLSHRLRSFRAMGLDQKFEGANFTIDSDGQYEGSASYSNGYNMAPPWTIYFCGLFDQAPSESKVFKGSDLEGNDLASFQTGSSISSADARVGALLSFESSSVTSRVGISFISARKACDSVQQEIPADSKLTDIVSQTKDIWNQDVLSKVSTTEKDVPELQHLYTSLYIMHHLPSNRTGENPGWQSTEPYFDDIFTFWDLFRTSTPLLHVLQPEVYEQLIRSVIDVWRNEGYLPNARSVNFNGPVQGGSNADMVLGDAYVKGVRGAINWADGYAAMVKDAEVVPPNNFDPRADTSSTKEGRGALPDWLDLGFITLDFFRSVSTGIEYAGNDFALFQVARGEANEADVDKYFRRSQNWRNSWNPDTESLGYKGFAMPRTRDGFEPFDPLQDMGYWRDPFYQASTWEYSLNPLHDMASVVALCGGAERFVSRLRMLFEYEVDPDNPKARIHDPGNQPSFAAPYLFHFAARPDLSVSTSRSIARDQFAPKPAGLPGNSDSGAMQSWLLWNTIGLFPLPTQTTFLIHSPLFEHLRIDLGGSKFLVINSTRNGGDKDTAIHVQRLRVNGQDWRKTWLTWTDIFADGGTLNFDLGPEPNSDWFDPDNLPPSPASANKSPSSDQMLADILPNDLDVTSVLASSNRPDSQSAKDDANSRRLLPLLSLLVLLALPVIAFFIFKRSRQRRRQQQQQQQQQQQSGLGGKTPAPTSASTSSTSSAEQLDEVKNTQT